MGKKNLAKEMTDSWPYLVSQESFPLDYVAAQFIYSLVSPEHLQGARNDKHRIDPTSMKLTV